MNITNCEFYKGDKLVKSHLITDIEDAEMFAEELQADSFIICAGRYPQYVKNGNAWKVAEYKNPKG